MNKLLLNRWVLAAAAILIVLRTLLSASAPQVAQAVAKPELKRALLGTVRIAVAVDKEKDSYSTGSGTVLTADGYILTNFHVMGDTDKRTLYNSKGIAMIGVNPSDLKSLPTWLYQAQLVKGDPDLDLAVLKVVATFKGGALPSSLGLTPVPLGDSDNVEIGDAVHVIGYPGIGGDSVTYTSGTIAGFLDENTDKKIDWLKTDAEINRGNSGGLAINDAGEMIGVPTAGVTDTEAAGKISLIRPINRASALIKSAVVQNGSGLDTPTGETPSTIKARVTSLVFSDSVDANDRPGKTATNFRSGVPSIYAFFDYSGFTDGQKFAAEWKLNGKTDVVTEFDWDGGTSGAYWISITNSNGVIDGSYDLTLSLDGVKLYAARMSVGVQAQPTATPPATISTSRFSTPTFAEGVTAANDPVNPHRPGQGFDEGMQQLYAFADYKSMQSGLSWSNIWFVDGEQVLRRDNTWKWGASGTFWVSVYNKGGLPSGTYTLELYVDDELVSRGETTIGAGGSLLAEDEGVQVTGVIVDADTQRPISGAAFLVLNPGVDVEEFLDDPSDADVLDRGDTDSKGQFSIATLLTRGETYSFVVAASNYKTVYRAGYTVDEDAESPLEFEIELQKR